jgi:hypothetical protein
MPSFSCDSMGQSWVEKPVNLTRKSTTIDLDVHPPTRKSRLAML